MSVGSAAIAAQTHRLTYVPGRDLEILYVGQKDQWCTPRLDLVLVTSQPLVLQNTGLITDQMARYIQKLRKSCPAIILVGISGHSRSQPDVALFEGSYAAKDNWTFSKLKLPERFETSSTNAVVQQGAAPQQSRTTPQNSSPEPNRQLTFQEGVELQKRLSFLGFPVGRLDGKLGRKTTLAISRFLATNRLAIPVRPDLDVLNALRLVAEGKRPTQVQRQKPKTKSIKRFNFSDYQDVRKGSPVNYGRLFALQGVSGNSSLLKSDRVLNAWLLTEAKDLRSPVRYKAGELAQKYKFGTKFDRQDVLLALQNMIEEELVARGPEFARPNVLKILVRTKVSVSGDYQAGRGFPLTYYSNSKNAFRLNVRDSEIEYSIKRLDANGSFSFAKNPLARMVPILEERKARILARLVKEKKRYTFEMRLYARLGKLAPVIDSRNRLRRLKAAAKIDGMMLVVFDRNDPSGRAKIVYEWDLTPAQQKRAQKKLPGSRKLTPFEFANWAGIKLSGGNLVMSRSYDKNYSGVLIDFQKINGGGNDSNSTYTRLDDGWAKFFNLIKLQQIPEYLNNSTIAIAAARVFLTEQEKAELTRGKKFLKPFDSYKDYDEFEFRDFLARFKAGKYAQRLKRYYPSFPIPVVDIIPVRLGRYDFEKKNFPIFFYETEEREWKSAFWKPDLYVNLYRKFDLQRYPRFLPLSVENARFLSNWFVDKGISNRTAYLAVFADMKAFDPKKSQYDVITRKVSLYLDKNLTQNIIDFSKVELTSP